MSYYNTTNLEGEDLAEAKSQARTQQDRILTFFEEHPGALFTPFEVREGAEMHQTPITSVRRAMTNLTDDGELVKTELTRLGKFGANNYTWRLAR